MELKCVSVRRRCHRTRKAVRSKRSRKRPQRGIFRVKAGMTGRRELGTQPAPVREGYATTRWFGSLHMAVQAFDGQLIIMSWSGGKSTPDRSRGQDDRREMIGERDARMFIRLAAIPQPLADGLPFQTVHQAIPKTTANAVNNAGPSRLRRERKAYGR